MTTVLEGDEGSASRPGRSLPPGKTRYPLYRRLGGPQGRSGQVRKISPPTAIRSPDRPPRSQSLYRLSCPNNFLDKFVEKIKTNTLNSFFFHIHTVHFGIIKVFFYSRTDAQVNCLKNSVKIYIKTVPTCFGAVKPSSGSALFELAKVTVVKIIN